MKFLWLLLILSLVLTIRLFTYNPNSYRHKQEIVVHGYIVETPEIHSGRQVFRFSGIRISTELVPLYSYGDKVQIAGTVERREFVSEEGRHVEYLEIRNPKITKEESENLFLLYVSNIRNASMEAIKRSIPSPEADLLIGIVFGEDSGFDRKTSDIFSKTGLMHIVAASGTNITIVGGLFYFSLLHFLGIRRALVISIFGIFIYAFLAGFSPSIQRAALMGGISYFGLYLGRQTYSAVSLILTGMVLTLINPMILSDIGFHLSFAATAGIIFIHPIIQRVRIFSKNLLLKDISITFSAYIALIPLLLFHFNSFTPFSVLINSLVLWTIPILTVVGGAAAIISLIVLPIGTLTLWIVYPILRYILFTAEFFSQMFPEYKTSGVLSLYFVLGYYISLVSLLFRFKK